jgi:hypothetical protein
MGLSDLSQGCCNKFDIVMIKKNVTRLTTQGCNNIVISWLYRTCWNNFVTSLITSTRLLQIVNSLFQTCWQLVTSIAKTTCWRLVDKLVTRCEIFACVWVTQARIQYYITVLRIILLQLFLVITKPTAQSTVPCIRLGWGY